MRETMLRVSKLKAVGRVVSMVFLLVAAMGPWFADSHPATNSLLCFVGIWYAHRGALILWGAGLGGVVAVATLAGEILVARLQFSMNHRQVFCGQVRTHSKEHRP